VRIRIADADSDPHQIRLGGGLHSTSAFVVFVARFFVSLMICRLVNWSIDWLSD